MTLKNDTYAIFGLRSDEFAKYFENNREIGWEAGIRTPITASRAPCPTVERPPSTEDRRADNLTNVTVRHRGQQVDATSLHVASRAARSLARRRRVLDTPHPGR